MLRPSQSNNWWLSALLLLSSAFALRLAAAFVWQRGLDEQSRFRFADSESYWCLAQCIVDGEPYVFGNTHDSRAFRTPGYPLLLAGLFWCLDDRDPPVLWARAQSALLGTVAVALVMVLAGQLLDRRTALVAGALAAVYPGAIAMSILYLPRLRFAR